MLDPFGIDQLSQDLYLAMLREPDADVRMLAELLEQPQTEIRRALDRLAEAGLTAGTDPDAIADDGGWRAIDPEIGLPALLARQQAEVAAQQARIEQGRLSIAMLLSRHKELASGSNDTGIRRLAGIDAIRETMAQVAEECESSVWSLNPGGAHSDAAMRSSRELTAKILDRGIEVRSVYSDSVRNDRATVAHMESLTALGAATRTHPAVPVRMVLVDRERVIVPVDADRTSASALLISGTGLVEALVTLYRTIWEQAKPLAKVRPRRAAALNEQEQHALRLWAKGHTDAAIGRKLGVSERTVRRMSEAIAEELKSCSRFQAGARAAFAGWITEDDTM